MCLEVFLGTDQEVPQPDRWLRIESRVPKDVRNRIASRYVISIGATHTYCGCGFLVEGENVDTDEVRLDDRQAHSALLGFVHEVASEQPTRLIFRWAGDSLRKTETRELDLDGLDTLDLSSAWDQPQDLLVRSAPVSDSA